MAADTRVRDAIDNLMERHADVEEEIAKAEILYRHIVARMKSLHEQRRNLVQAIEALDRVIYAQEKKDDDIERATDAR